MSQITIGTPVEFKKMIESSLGRPLESNDIAVEHKKEFYSRVDALPIERFVEKMNQFAKDYGLTSADVGVMTVEDIESLENSTGKRNTLKK